MSEPQVRETWPEGKEEKKANTKVKTPTYCCSDVHVEIQAKLESWYYSTFINKGLDIQTYNHIYQSVEKLKLSIAESFKEK